jgi:hypothetical protein
LYDSLIERLQRGGVAVGSDLFEAPTGRTKVDRQIGTGDVWSADYFGRRLNRLRLAH